jgi:hypothetical protein
MGLPVVISAVFFITNGGKSEMPLKENLKADNKLN